MTRTAVVVRHVLFEDLGILEPLLAQRGFDVRYLDAGIDPLTGPEWLEADLVVVLGGPVGVGDVERYPFLADEIRGLARRVALERPTLGICLGAQLLATALGAEVTAGGTFEVGYAPLDLTAEGCTGVLSPLEGVPVLHWHGDRLADPDGTDRLARTETTPNQAFARGKHLLGLQFHLEADPAQLERWLIGYASDLAGLGVDPDTIRADTRTHGARLRAQAEVVLGDWLDGLDLPA